MLGIESDIASSASRLWIAAGSAALLVFVCAMAFRWSRTQSTVRVSVVVAGAALGAVLTWAFLAGASDRDQDAERRALELRATQLNAQALAPGSSLACLDGLAGPGVEAACEKALFAAPATVASATSYIAARLTLLADLAAYGRRGGVQLDGILLPLRRSLESDRFGFVAHTLAMRDGCSSENCKALALLHDASRVRANLSAQTLDRYLDRYAAAWSQGSDGPTAEAAPAQPTAGQPGQRKVTVDIDFPTAASIPAVSIMNPEPKGPAAVQAGAGDSSAQAASAPTKPARKPAKNTPAQTAAAPTPAPANPAPATPVDPVWSPGATLASPQVPVQPEASAGTPARAQ